MEKFNFGDKAKEVEKEHGVGGEYFKIKEGDNIVRVLSGYEVIASHFIGTGERRPVCFGKDKGCPFHGEGDEPAGIKCVFWVIDRTDGGMKLAEMPYSFASALRDLQEAPQTAFEVVPMPYDVNLKAKNAGTKEVEYEVVALDEAELADEIYGELSNKKTIAEVVANKKARAKTEFEKVQAGF